MKNKYYTPDIAEFHVGFEFEQASIDNNWYITSWNKKIFSEETDLEFIYQYRNLQRVKYLDEQDILDCGFEYERKEEGLFEGFNIIYTNYVFGKGIIELIKYGDLDHISIIQITHGERINLFIGNIKNKSELEKLLKQLGCSN